MVKSLYEDICMSWCCYIRCFQISDIYSYYSFLRCRKGIQMLPVSINIITRFYFCFHRMMKFIDNIYRMRSMSIYVLILILVLCSAVSMSMLCCEHSINSHQLIHIPISLHFEFKSCILFLFILLLYLVYFRYINHQRLFIMCYDLWIYEHNQIIDYNTVLRDNQ